MAIKLTVTNPTYNNKLVQVTYRFSDDGPNRTFWIDQKEAKAFACALDRAIVRADLAE
jgi:hypothetical protein